MKPLVYLAGPIAGTEAHESIEWRVFAFCRLDNRGVETLDPMRAKRELAAHPIGHDFNAYADRGVFFTAGAINIRDHTDVVRADALLVNLIGAESISVGTAMEMWLAQHLGKPIVVAIEADGSNPHDKHPMVHQAIGPFRVDNLDDAIDAVAVILNR